MEAWQPSDWALYLPASAQLRETGLACRGAGQQSGHLPPVETRVLTSHALVLISDGSGTVHDGAAARDVHAPAWMWLAPGVPHSYAPEADGWSEHWVLFEGVAARTYRSLSLLGAGHVLGRGGPPTAEREETFAALRRAGESPGRRSQLVAAALVHRLLGTVIDDLEDGETSSLRTLAATAAEELTVAQRAALCSLSPRELRDQVRRATGLTPHEFVIATRLARAQELLARSELTVAQVGAEVGIDDPSYFTRLFTRRIGTSPRAFRREQRR